MRKINMKRKNRKEKVEQDNEEEKVEQNIEEENGINEKSNDSKNVSDEETKNSDSEPEPELNSDPEPEPDSKKRQSKKRKSIPLTKKSNKKEPEEPAQYEVEEVLDEKMVGRVRHYLIRWKGYEPESDTWEPESTLKCPELIKKFKSSRDGKEKANNKNGRMSKRGRKSEKDKPKNKIKSGKKAKNSKTEEVNWESDDEFEVGNVLDVSIKKNGKREFLVSWKGYPRSQDSWEPEENLDCIDLIKKFMDKAGKAKNKVSPKSTGNKGSQRLSRRLDSKQRVQYHDGE